MIGEPQGRVLHPNVHYVVRHLTILRGKRPSRQPRLREPWVLDYGRVRFGAVVDSGSSASMEPDGPDDRLVEEFEGRRERHKWPSWSPPEIAAVALLTSAVLYSAGNILIVPSSGGWRGTIAKFADWSTAPWVTIALLLASLMVWHIVSRISDTVLANRSGSDGSVGSDPGENEERDDLDNTGGSGDDDLDGGGDSEIWDRAWRGLIIGGVAGLLAAITTIALLLVTVIIVLTPTERMGPYGFSSRIGEIVSQLALLVPTVATLVIFRRIYNTWSNLA